MRTPDCGPNTPVVCATAAPSISRSESDSAIVPLRFPPAGRFGSGSVGSGCVGGGGCDCVLRDYGLPTELPPGIAADRLLGLTLQDKKVRAGRARWVLPTAIGAAVVRDDVPEALVRAVVEG